MADGPDGSLLIETAPEREARERAQEQSTDRRYRKLQLWFNGALMIATIVTAVIVLYQNRILNQSLVEMRTQSSAAKDAANAAQVAARATENQLPIQLGQMDIAREQISGGNRIANDSIRVARDANAQSLEGFRADQRAWLNISAYAIQARAVKTAAWQAREPGWATNFASGLAWSIPGKRQPSTSALPSFLSLEIAFHLNRTGIS